MKLLVALGLGTCFGLTAAAQAPAPTPAGPTFCADLRAVVVETGTSFDRFKGAQSGEPVRDASGNTTIRYAALRSLGGAARCAVKDYIPQGSKALRSYECEWTPIASKIATVTALAQAAENCVGKNDPLDRLSTFADDGADADIYTDDFSINIGAGTVPKVFFRIRDF